MTFEELVKEDWLAAFSQYASYGEASPRLMRWVGISTVAAALGRKVWFDQDEYQWSPNFYILIVGEQGAVRKSTSIDIGMRLLRQVEGVNIGPSSATWQAFVERVAESFVDVRMPNGATVRMSCMTLALSEFGTFFKPEDQDMIDVLTHLWDGSADPFEKVTKTNGSDLIENPWINIIAATTPKWISRKLTDDLIGGGLVSRFIFLHGEVSDKAILYPRRNMPAARTAQRAALIEGLRRIADMAGEVSLTEDAFRWGQSWYEQHKQRLLTLCGTLEAGFLARKPTHLHKLAMVIAAARQSLPVIGTGHLQEALSWLDALEEDTRRVFGVVGQTKTTQAARQIVEALRASGKPMEKRLLYRTHFYRTMEWNQYEDAVKSAVNAELVLEVADVAKPLLMLRMS